MRECPIESSAEAVIYSNEKKLFKVLHVDDEASFLKMAKQCLETQGPFQVDTACSVKEAFEKLKKETYDAVVSDYQMPLKDGIEFLKELRQSGSTVPFMIFTGKGREEVAIRALNLGADQYLNKTGDPKTVYGELAHAIRQAVDRKSAQENMKESEERYRNLFEMAPDAILTLNMKGVITSCNGATARLTGFSKDEIVGKHFSELSSLDLGDIPKYVASFNAIARGKISEPLQVSWYAKDGTTRYSELRFSLIEKDARIVGIQVIAIDTTGRRKAEEELKESEEKFRNLAEQSPNMIFINKKGKVVYANEKAAETMGYRKEEFYSGFNFLDLIAPESRELVKSSYKTHAEGKNVNPYEYKLITKEGRIMHAILASKLITYDGEQAILGTVVDITERKKAEDALRESQDKYKDLFESAADVMVTLDLKGNFTSVNRAVLRFGYKKEDLIGKSVLDFIPKEHQATMRDDLTKAIHGETIKNEIEVVAPDGNKTVEYNGNAMVRNGSIVGVQVSLRDVSARRNAEDAWRASEEKFRTLFDEAMDAIVVADAQTGLMIDCNRAATELVGRSKSELIGEHQRILHPPQDITEAGLSRTFEQHIKEKAGQVLETQVITKTGEIREVAIKASPIEVGGKKVLQGIFRDITENKQAEEALRRSSEQARSLLEFQNKVIDTAIVWIDLLDREGNITLWNRAAELISGYSREEVVGHKKIWDWLYPDPQYCAEIFAHQRRAIEDRESAFQNFETVIRCKNGVMKTISWHSNNIVDEKGEPVGSIAMGIDVTELKEAEKELKAAMKRLEIMNEKLRVVGGLTRHDARNKLSVISGNAFLASEELAGDSKVQGYLREIDVATQQVVRIFDFAKAYEMLGVEELVYVDVEKTVGEAVSLFSDLKGVKVANDCRGLSVLADSLLRQLFYNLVDNSLKYGQKTTRIRVYYEETGQDELKLVYEDDGVGIPAAEKPKLFKEGYSTGGSTGYGLYLTSKMVEVYGWTIQETGTHGEGAQFTITIPKTNKDGKESVHLGRGVAIA
jgi:PAS domain S-box-containing protein